MTNLKAVLWGWAASLLFASSAHACWVSKVKKDPEGIRVIFDERFPLFDVWRHDGTVQRYVRDFDGQIVLSDTTGVVPQPNGLLLKLGDRASGGNSPHDTCTMTVIEQDGKLALKLNSFLFLHGIPDFKPRSEENVIKPE